MLTRGNTDQAGAPSSPSSRADRAPSDSEPPVATAASPGVVEFTRTEKPWDATPARRTAEPAPLRTSKRASLTRPTATSTTPRKAASDSPHGSESDLEDKPPAPPAKKAREAPAKAKPIKAVSSAKPAPAVTRADSGLNLSSFMESFEGRTALIESAPSEELPAVAATLRGAAQTCVTKCKC
ncbi:hypothetical protein PHYPSEUDO_013394 [Phytophthora pseudosyringae]|uniref:Uncharacterized protein n=1 Tax=Phytophthora pseudosyringae TaxID=221518 RepID=A0A8T1V832_9STRA|nr:hypothetical protein PHYPSEUDO_013394 [Phytophthora pseudosyringae]